MALIRCPECGKEISSLAPSCPQCGFPLNEIDGKDNKTPVSIIEDIDGFVSRIEDYIFHLEKMNSIVERLNNNQTGKERLASKRPLVVKDSGRLVSIPLAITAFIFTVIAVVCFIMGTGNIKIIIGTGLFFVFFVAAVFGGVNGAILQGEQQSIERAYEYLNDLDDLKEEKKYLEENDLPEIPEAYRYVFAMEKIAELFRNGRAESVKEAINIFELETRLDKRLELAEQQNKILIAIMKITAADASLNAMKTLARTL